MTASATTGEPDRAPSQLPELVELEAALVGLVGPLRENAALSREFKEVARDSPIRGETSTTIETAADMDVVQAQLEADVTLLAQRLRPVAQGLASLAPELVKEAGSCRSDCHSWVRGVDAEGGASVWGSGLMET